jgi:tetratricopeptide (TPR) repeat protein
VNSRQVGEALRVDYILEGSVRKAANRIRITAQLVDVGSGFQIWAERYDRLIEDIFDVQVEVSERIAGALELSLTESEKRSIAKKPTDDLRAYDFYMRGNEFLSRRWQKDRLAAVRMYEHALSIDPHFALAYVALAEAYSYNYLFFGGERSWLEKMIEMNEKALSLDPDLVEAEFGVGMAYFLQKRFARAKEEFAKVIEAKSDFYPAHYWLIWTSILLNDFETAIAYGEKAAALKPYSEEPWHLIEQSYRMKGDLEAADEAGRVVIDLAAHKLDLNPNDLMALSRMAIAYANKGMEKKAVDAINTITELDPEDGMALYNCSGAYSVLGMKEEALRLFAISLEKGTTNLIEWVDNDPYLDPMRGDPEFNRIRERFSV